MRKLSVFNAISIDGYFADPGGDISWAHKQDPEWSSRAAENASGGGVLMFGRITYDLMTSYWPIPMAAKNNPVVARRMNEMPKIVVSNSIDKPAWNNTTPVKGDLPTAVRSLKQESGETSAFSAAAASSRSLRPNGSSTPISLSSAPSSSAKARHSQPETHRLPPLRQRQHCIDLRARLIRCVCYRKPSCWKECSQEQKRMQE
jgi:dihydrofolate reductase